VPHAFPHCIIVTSCRYKTLQAVTKRIGILQLMNPMCVEGYYELDLSERQDAIVARVLVDLSVKEPGENWIDETFNGNGFELPATWVQKLPEKGILTLTYAVESWAIKRKARTNWMQYAAALLLQRQTVTLCAGIFKWASFSVMWRTIFWGAAAASCCRCCARRAAMRVLIWGGSSCGI